MQCGQNQEQNNEKRRIADLCGADVLSDESAADFHGHVVQHRECFLVQEYAYQNENKTFLYSVDYPSSLVKSMLAKQPAVIVAPDRLTVFSTSGKSEVLKIYTINGELYDSKALDTEGKTTYMTTGLDTGMYIYEVGGESGKFVVK